MVLDALNGDRVIMQMDSRRNWFADTSFPDRYASLDNAIEFLKMVFSFERITGKNRKELLKTAKAWYEQNADSAQTQQT
jgi:hypothetical protein